MPISASDMPVSNQSYMNYLKVFGRNPKIVDMLQLYVDLRAHLYEGAVVENSFQRFRLALNAMESEADTEPSLVALADKGAIIETLLRRLDNDGDLSVTNWRKLVEEYSLLLRVLVADRDLFWTGKATQPAPNYVRWIQLRAADPKEARKERIRRDDPELFQRMTQSNELRERLDRAINQRIYASGQIATRLAIRGRFMMVGVDPTLVPDTILIKGRGGKPDRRISKFQALSSLDDMYVVNALPEEAVTFYKDDGTTVNRSQFIKDADAENKALKELSRVNALMRKGTRGKYTSIDPAELRKVSPEAFMQEYGTESPVADEYVALTDDPYKSTALTKIYPVKDFRGNQVITAGRFKGFFVADLINKAGRLIEGSVNYFNPETNDLDRRETTGEDGKINIKAVTEPYVTVDRGQLMLTIPGAHSFSLIRQAAKNLTKKVPGFLHEEGSRNTIYRFTPKEFSAVRDAIGSMALSNAAARLLKAYFDNLQKADRATEDRNLRKYSADKLQLKRPLRRQQAQAVAWLDAYGNKGICAADTGVGKTTIAIATMQNLRRKGAPEKANGRFLFVCKKALAGNIPKEIRDSVTPEAGDELMEMLDIITYDEFARRVVGSKKRPATDPTFADNYTAIFFDEAHEVLKKKTNAVYRAVAAAKTQQKILLTASPMVQSPLEIFTLKSVVDGVDLNTKEGRAAETEFVSRFAEKVGNRVVGIKRADTSKPTYNLYVKREKAEGREPLPYKEWPGEMDVSTSREFNLWIKTNLFYADKRDVVDNSRETYEKYAAKEISEGRTPTPYAEWGGTQLKDLNKIPPVAVTMDPQVEAVYKQTMKQVTTSLKEVADQLKKSYKGREDFGTPEFRAIAVEAAKMKLRKPLALLTKLSDTPNRVIPGARNPKIDQTRRLLDQIKGRTLIFTDSLALAEDTYAQLVKDFPGRGCAVAFSDKIMLTTAGGQSVTFTERRYPDFTRPQGSGGGVVMTLEAGRVVVKKNDDPEAVGYALASEETWKVNILQWIQSLGVQALILTGTYAVGQNLQAFTNVIHLDRDDWSNETMKQRSARAWRSGQVDVVNEYTIDAVYSDLEAPKDADKTLDELRRIVQDMDEDIFKEVVIDSQTERVGQEWTEMKHRMSEIYKVDAQLLERALSPYATHYVQPEDSSDD